MAGLDLNQGTMRITALNLPFKIPEVINRLNLEKMSMLFR